MRRKDREITDQCEIYKIMKRCDVCSVAMYDDDFPYILPLNFGVAMEGETFVLYFHGAPAGTKLELLQKNSHVGFEMNGSHSLILGEKSCDSTMKYESVCGNGTITLLADAEKVTGLQTIMNQYAPGVNHEFGKNEVSAVVVMKLTVNKITGKKFL